MTHDIDRACIVESTKHRTGAQIMRLREQILYRWRLMTGRIRQLNPAQNRAAAEYWTSIGHDLPREKRAEMLRPFTYTAPQRKHHLTAR